MSTPIATDDSYSLDTVATGSTTLLITEGGSSSGGGGSTGGGGTGTGGGTGDPPNDGGEQIPAGFSLGTVTFKQIVGGSSSALAAVTMGKYFAQGEVPAGKFPILKTSANAVVNVQTDAKTRWPDGSLRFCRMAFLPTGTSVAGQSVEYTVDIADNNHPWQLITKAMIEATDFDLEVSITEGGTTYTANAMATLIAESTPNYWAQGGACTSIVDLVAPLVDGGSNEHPNLEVRFYIDACAHSLGFNDVGPIRCRWAIENTRSFLDRNGASNTFGKKTLTNLTVTCTDSDGNLNDVTLNVNNVEIARQGRITREIEWYPSLGWQNNFYQGGGYVAWTSYINAKSDGVIPNYLLVNTPSATLDSYQTSAAARTMNSNLNFRVDMPSGGADVSIAPLMNVDAVYFANAEPDERIWQAVMATHEQATNWHIHVRDDATALPLMVSDHPNISIVGSSSSPAFPGWSTSWSEFDGYLTNAQGTDWEADVAHQPSFGFTPYLLTGDYFWLEEMQFWSAYNVFRINPPYRDYGDGALYREQLRGLGWSIRTLAHTVGCTPTTHPLYTDFSTYLENTRLKYEAYYITNPQKSALGFVNHTNNTGIIEDNTFKMRPWMHAFFVHGMFVARAWGGDDWQQILKFACRLQGNAVNHSQFCEKAVAAYSYVVAGTGGTTYDHTNYRQVLQSTYALFVGACPASWSEADGYHVNSYNDQAGMALAYAAELGFYNAEAARASQRDYSISVGYEDEFQLKPLFSIAPRYIGTPEPVRTIPNRHWFDMSSIAGSQYDAQVALPNDATRQIADYSGGLFDTKRNLFVIHGAGHTTGNNAIIGLDITTGNWQLISQRSTQEAEDVVTYPDGSPSARHIYDGACYIPAPYDKYFYGGGFNYTTAGTFTNRHWIFDPNAVDENDISAAWSLLSDPAADGDVCWIAAWDAVREVVICHFSRDLVTFDPSDNSWVVRNYYSQSPQYDQFAATGHGGDYSSDHQKMVIAGRNTLWVWDLSDLENPTRTLVSPTGNQSIIGSDGPSVRYHPPSKKFIMYHPETSQTSIFLFDPDTNVITEQQVAGSNTVSPSSAVWGSGVGQGFRRAEWVPDIDALISVPDLRSPAYMIRPES